MDDDVAPVDQNPVALIEPLDRDLAKACGFEFFPEMFGHRGDVALRRAGCDDHVIGKIGFAGEIDDDHVLRFVVVERRRDQINERVAFRRRRFLTCYGCCLLA